MKIAAAVLALALAVPALAAPAPVKKILAENADLVVAISASGPAGAIASKTRIQAQSQFSAVRTVKGKSSKALAFSGVPVINPNNGKARMELKGRVSWGDDDAVELQTSIELELGAEAVVYDAEGVTVRVKISPAD